MTVKEFKSVECRFKENVPDRRRVLVILSEKNTQIFLVRIEVNHSGSGRMGNAGGTSFPAQVSIGRPSGIPDNHRVRPAIITNVDFAAI